MKSNNFQAIYIMWLREMKRFLRSKSRVIGSLMVPFFFLIFMGFGFKSNFDLPGMPQGTSYINFLVPGIIGMTMLFTSTFAGISVLWDKEFGFLKEIMVAPVRRSAVVLGRIAGGVTTSLIQGILILIISLFMGFQVMSFFGLLLAFLFMLLISVGFIGFGIAIASKMRDIHGFSLIMQFIVFPIFILSGTFFPLANLPRWLVPISYIDPLTYGVDGLRASLIGFSQFPASLDLILLFIFDFFMVIFGTYLFAKMEA